MGSGLFVKKRDWLSFGSGSSVVEEDSKTAETLKVYLASLSRLLSKNSLSLVFTATLVDG